MKKLWIAVLMVAMLSCGLALAGDQDKQVEELVNRAADAFKQHDKAYMTKLLNASAGPFRPTRSLYVFLLDYKGVMLAHPAVRKLVGKSQWDFVDAKGLYIAREQVRIAKEQGQGWMEYWWLRPGEQKPTLKRTFIKKVPGEDLLVGAGYYVENAKMPGTQPKQ